MDMDTTTDGEQTGPSVMKLPIRPGYVEQVLNNKTYVVPKVLGQHLGEGWSLARIEKPDLREALEMTGGVRLLQFIAVHSIYFSMTIFHLDPTRDQILTPAIPNPVIPDSVIDLTCHTRPILPILT